MNWDFKYRPDRGYWEAYYSPQGPEMAELYVWCYATFGNPTLDLRWDCHGGWIKLLHEEDVSLFLLRWS